MDQISHHRFSKKSAQAFKDLKKSTKYNTFEKRDGGILTKAFHNGNLIQGP